MDTGSSTHGARLAAHTRRLRLLVRHLAGPAIRARVELDDVVQEVFMRAITAPSGLPRQTGEDDHELWAFLAHLARNTVIDIARAARTAKRSARVERLARTEWSRHGAGDPAARTAGPATRAVAAETQAKLEEAFAQLPPDYRRVLGLRQFEGLSAAETAQRMGRTETAVHSLYRRALMAWEEKSDF